jgi:hypothetical protein
MSNVNSARFENDQIFGHFRPFLEASREIIDQLASLARKFQSSTFPHGMLVTMSEKSRGHYQKFIFVFHVRSHPFEARRVFL